MILFLAKQIKKLPSNILFIGLALTWDFEAWYQSLFRNGRDARCYDALSRWYVRISLIENRDEFRNSLGQASIDGQQGQVFFVQFIGGTGVETTLLSFTLQLFEQSFFGYVLAGFFFFKKTLLLTSVFLTVTIIVVVVSIVCRAHFSVFVRLS